MTRRYVNQLANGDSVDEILLVVDKQLRSNRQGNLYLYLDLRDRTGSISARLWNANEDLARRFEAGDYLATRGKVQTFQNSLQLILTHLDVIDPTTVDPAEFMAASPRDAAKLTTRLRELVMSMTNPHLRAMAECFLIDQPLLDKFTRAPAGIKNHHAYTAGLLEHVVTMLEVADRIAPLYPELDRDLLLAGILLHDIGKIDELCFDHVYGYTDEGQLVGHLVMGVVMLRQKLQQVQDLMGEPFPDELRLRLEHMIVCHHGTHEFGSPKLPMTPEAIALHYLDNLDAKINLFTREIRDDPSRQSSWTPYNQSLGRRLFKGKAESNGSDADGDPLD